MIAGFVAAHDEQVKLCASKRLTPSSGPCVVKFFLAKPAEFILLKDIPPCDYRYIISLIYLMHFGTSVSMWLDRGGTKTGRTFASFIAFLSPIMRHILLLLGWAYLLVSVKDLAECSDQPFAAKDSAPLTPGYKFEDLVQASVRASFSASTGLLNWGLSFVLCSLSLARYLPRGQGAGGMMVDLGTPLGPGNLLRKHPDGTHGGTAQHLSLPTSPAILLALLVQAAAALGVRTGANAAPVVAALSDPALSTSMSAAMEAVDPAVLAAMGVAEERNGIEKLLLLTLGATIGALAFAALTAAASCRNRTLKALRCAAVAAGFVDAPALVEAALKGESMALGVMLRDAREERGKPLRDILQAIMGSRGHAAAAAVLDKCSSEDSGGGAAGKKRRRSAPVETTPAELKCVLSASALHLECSFAGHVSAHAVLSFDASS